MMSDKKQIQVIFLFPSQMGQNEPWSSEDR